MYVAGQRCPWRCEEQTSYAKELRVKKIEVELRVKELEDKKKQAAILDMLSLNFAARLGGTVLTAQRIQNVTEKPSVRTAQRIQEGTLDRESIKDQESRPQLANDEIPMRRLIQ